MLFRVKPSHPSRYPFQGDSSPHSIYWGEYYRMVKRLLLWTTWEKKGRIRIWDGKLNMEETDKKQQNLLIWTDLEAKRSLENSQPRAPLLQNLSKKLKWGIYVHESPSRGAEREGEREKDTLTPCENIDRRSKKDPESGSIKACLLVSCGTIDHASQTGRPESRTLCMVSGHLFMLPSSHERIFWDGTRSSNTY